MPNSTTVSVDKLIQDIFLHGTKSSETPELILLTGGVGSGKTTMRKKEFGTGYVAVDGGDIFERLGNYSDDDLDSTLQVVSMVGFTVAKKAIEENYNIITELIGADRDQIEGLIKHMEKKGYKTSVVFVNCDPEEAYKRHLKAVESDKSYLSCYFTQDMHINWLTES